MTKIKKKSILKNGKTKSDKTKIESLKIFNRNHDLKKKKSSEIEHAAEIKPRSSDSKSSLDKIVKDNKLITTKSDNEESTVDKNQDDKNDKVNVENNKQTKKDSDEKIERTVFVGNLPSNTKVVQLKKIFSKCTVVSCRFRLATGKPILQHKLRKNSASINAYVVFANVADVDIALALNGTDFKGHHIRITRSNEKISHDQQEKSTIFVGNLKYSATDEKLYEIFSSCGEIEFVRTIRNENGCSGVAYVCFKAPESVGLALELNQTLLDDRPINVEKYSKNKSGRSKNRKPVEKMSPVERRIMLKLIKDKKIDKKDAQRLPFNNKFSTKFDKMGKNTKKFKKQQKVTDSHKKSDFHGVHVNSKKKLKKKKVKNVMAALAKKIAPQ